MCSSDLYLNVINKLLIIFVSSTSSKFRIYGVINNHYVQDKDGQNLNNLKDEGITSNDSTELITYKYRGKKLITKDDTTGEYNHHHISLDNDFGRVYNIKYYLNDIFKLSNAPDIVAKDIQKSINSIMGYTDDYIVFNKKGTDESNKNI